MRKLLIVAYLLLALPLLAEVRTTDEAMAVASRFLMQSSMRRSSSLTPQQKLTLASTRMQLHSDKPAFYVINRGENDGFVIVSADSRCQTILGYTEKGTFDENRIPANVDFWLNRYVAEMVKLPAYEIIIPASHPVELISPLLGDIAWDQDTPFNNQCPIDNDGGRCMTGCLATAAAQIMCYWRYPEHGVGTHAYNWKNSAGETTRLEVDYAAATYDWKHMVGQYTSWLDKKMVERFSYTTTQAEAVAQLMYHVGVSCNMNYHSGGSSSFSYKMAEALRRNFGYDKGLRMLYKDVMSLNAFTNAFMDELRAGRPILMTGSKENAGGHAFVCDGVDEDGMFHINWGWGGYMDGYFSLSSLHPAHEGIGGVEGEGGFNMGVDAIIGIQPDRGSLYSAPCVGADNISFMPLTVARDSDIGIDVEALINYGPVTWRGFVAVNVYQNGERVLSSDLLDTCDIQVYKGFHASGSDAINFTGMPEGRYRMVVEYNSLTDTTFIPVWWHAENPYFDVIVDADSVRISKSEGNYFTCSALAIGPGRVRTTAGSRLESGEEITIEAVPYEGARFLHWNSAQVVGEQQMEEPQITMMADTNIVLAAVFGYDDQVMYLRFGVEQGEEHLGQVKAEVLADEIDGIYVPADSGLYPADCMVMITALPADGEHFLGWNRNGEYPASSNPRKVMLYSEEGFWAHFSGATDIRTTEDPIDIHQPMYNILGMQVDESYRGIIIQNGHKHCNF